VLRKVILSVTGAFVALFGLFGVQVGLPAVDAYSVIGSLLIIAAYVFTEFKKDWANFKADVVQTNKWSDPAFWTAFLGSVLLPLLSLFGVALTEQIVSIVATILAVIVPIIVNLFRKTEPAA
jgi:xanthosine utilization system XapX-like protein